MRLAKLTFLSVLSGMLLQFGVVALCAADEPALPIGLDDTSTETAVDEPALPSGLDSNEDTAPALPSGLDSAEPELPSGLETKSTDQPARPAKKQKSLLKSLNDAGFSGFIETRGGTRTQNDPYEKQASIGEARLQLQWQKHTDFFTFKFTGDLLYDQVDNALSDVNLRRGSGWFDLREAWVGFSPFKWMDVKVGRQIFTWGTGDLLFLNDIFPKDWQSFGIGRDLEYLKAPSDAMKLSMFSEIVNMDFVYVPLANVSRSITGERLSYFNPMLDHLAGQNAIIESYLPSTWFEDGEYATRLYRKVGSYELAAYGSWGYFNTPEGYNPIRRKSYYPRLNTYGGSIRGPVWRGIANFEAAYYDSAEDRHGDDPFIRNSEVRLLAGYEMDLPEIAQELTIGLQYYVELMMNHADYMQTLPPGMAAIDSDRHVITLRVTKQLMNQNLTLSMFTFYSPTDNDAYLRPKIKYKINDNWTTELGGNVFLGKKPDTFYGQFQKDTNVYISLRYSF